MGKGVFLSEITYETAKDLINEKSIVVLPIGGGVKEHGDHMPLGTDYYVTDWVAKKVTENYEVLTLPTLPYAYFPAFRDWKGSVTIEADNFINFVRDILLSYVRFGVKKFLIIDGGVSTHIPLKILSLDMNNKYDVKVAVTNYSGLGVETEKEICTQKQGGHGDEAETSIMLYINEKLVDMGKTVEEYRFSVEGTVKNGVEKVYLPMRMSTQKGTNGNSTLATKEKGEKILLAQVKDILEFLENFDKLTEDKFN